ncbi:sporulation protein YqfD [Alkalibacillus flavidus]
MMNQYDLMTVTITGEQPEAFIQSIVDRGYPVYGVKRIDDSSLFVKVSPQAIRLMKQTRRAYHCSILLQEKPRLWRFYHHKHQWISYSFGVVLVCLVIVLLSNVIWRVDIVGGSPELRYDVRQSLNELGLKQGEWVFRQDDLSRVERELMNQIEELAYVGLSQEGSSFTITVEETDVYEPPLNEEPVNLIAKQTGVIQSMFIETGRPLVRIHDTVNKGDVLVSGELEEEGDVQVHAEGEVIADVWYRVQASIPLDYRYQTVEQKPSTKYSLTLFDNWNLFKPDRPDDLIHTSTRPVYFLDWQLPVSIHRHQIHTITDQQTEFNLDEQLEREIEEQLKRQLGSSIDVTYQKVLHEERDSDKVNLDMFIKVHENIVQEQKINQGD